MRAIDLRTIPKKETPIGETGEEVEVTARVTYTRECRNSTMNKFVTEEGAVLVWYSSRRIKLDVGKTYVFGCKIKDLTLHHGEQQVLVNHIRKDRILDEHRRPVFHLNDEGPQTVSDLIRMLSGK